MQQTILSQVLPNGMVLLGEPMPQLESAAFTFLLPAGAVHDPADREGLAQFSSEMMLRGAGPRDSRELVSALENLGVEHSEAVGDAHLSFSGATLSRNLLPALDLYADILLRPRLPEEEVEPVRATALQELQAIEDEPSHKVMQELRRRHYPPPWGRPSQGNLAGMRAITREDVQRHFDQRVRPEGAILGVAGRFDWDALCRKIGELFNRWTGTAAAPPPVAATRDRSTHLSHDANQTQIGVAYASVPYRHPDYFQAWGAVGALSGGMSARLFTEVREKRGLCYSVYASYHTLLDRGGVLCYAGTSAERAQETLDVLVGELCRLAKGIEPHEIERLKARIKSSLIMQQESSSARSGGIARDWYHLGRVRTLDEVARIVDALSCETINAYLAQNPPSDFTVVTLGPQPLEMPRGVS